MGYKVMKKRLFLLALMVSSLSSCQPSGATYADNLAQGVSEGYVFYTGLSRSLSDGSDSRHLLSSIEYDDNTYDLIDDRTTNTFFSTSEDQVLVISADGNMGRSLIFEYNYADGSTNILDSIKTSSPDVSLLSGGAVLIYGRETSYIYKAGSLLNVPGRVLWLGQNSALVSPIGDALSLNNDNDLELYKLDNGVFSEEATISNPTEYRSPIALVSSNFSDECIIKKSENSAQYYVLNVNDYQSGFIESDTKNYITTYTARLNVSPYGLSKYSYGAACFYTASTFTLSDKGITLQWKPGDEEFIPLSRSDDKTPEISYLEQANLIHIKYDSKNVFTYNRVTKELTSSGCMFNEVPMSSQYTLWENGIYQFSAQNYTYKSLGPGNTAISFLLRKDKRTGVIDRMQKKYLSGVQHCFPFAFNHVETSGAAK